MQINFYLIFNFYFRAEINVLRNSCSQEGQIKIARFLIRHGCARLVGNDISYIFIYNEVFLQLERIEFIRDL